MLFSLLLSYAKFLFISARSEILIASKLAYRSWHSNLSAGYFSTCQKNILTDEAANEPAGSLGRPLPGILA
jgi:hypothetical protein